LASLEYGRSVMINPWPGQVKDWKIGTCCFPG